MQDFLNNTWESVFPTKNTLESYEMMNVTEFANKEHKITSSTKIDNLSLLEEWSGRNEFAAAINQIFDDIPSSGTLESLINVIEPSFKLCEPKTINNMVLQYNNFKQVELIKIVEVMKIVEVIGLTPKKLTYTNKICGFLCNFAKKISIEYQYILFDNG